ncbi:uncharacterized protein CTRU02_200764 [Colletotrichum truncatum]|uniref:Uncharacterized protein n=1 Tax=Colletotrichum truncatum TaxID=5467 RepID=A0ACC3ZFH9_COLTU|nr:uncharacterized protein CTRU02_00531 [Colletotrichum truncatum]KAF6801782.1 hypothetical protein CTRU02_00531 [Colletotrichum truncatum]
MSGPLGFTSNPYGKITPSFFFYPDAIPKANTPITWGVEDHEKIPETWVTITLGDGKRLNNPQGNFPSVALWNEEGEPIARFTGKGPVKIGKGGHKTQVIQQTLNGRKDEDPGYIMLSADEDAICIAMIQVSNGRHSSVFFGDTGYVCGQTWYYSSIRMSEQHINFLAPVDSLLNSRCAWLDADHSGEINARAMSYHLRDMIPSNDKLALYNLADHKYLCGSTRRFAWWKNLRPNGKIPFFNPPLEYIADSEDRRKEGADKFPTLALDDIHYNRDVYIEQGESPDVAKYYEKHPYATNRKKRNAKLQLSKRQGSNMDTERIIVTEIPGQTAREICEDPNSAGYDIASYVDMKYCDLSERKLYDLCSGTITSNCFDANSTAFVGVINARGENSAPLKEYKERSHWK